MLCCYQLPCRPFGAGKLLKLWANKERYKQQKVAQTQQRKDPAIQSFTAFAHVVFI